LSKNIKFQAVLCDLLIEKFLIIHNRVVSRLLTVNSSQHMVRQTNIYKLINYGLIMCTCFGACPNAEITTISKLIKKEGW